ncbi:hypothetical protein ACFLWR_03535 [Chloroflexota bacterium]
MNRNTPEWFTSSFNKKFPGAYRLITVEDVNDMTDCGLIGRYGYYLENIGLSECYGFNKQDDYETVRGILQYEQMRAKRQRQPKPGEKPEPPKCKRCGRLLPVKPKGKKGRSRAYCSGCESFRDNDRKRKSSSRSRKQSNKSPSTKTGPSPSQLHCELEQ